MNPLSAKSSNGQINKLAKLVVRFGFDSVFDFGAGKEGKVDLLFRQHRILYLPYDPFNRCEAVNNNTLHMLRFAEISICSNVLNVVEDKDLEDTISLLADCVKDTKSKICYLTVYYKKGLQKNRRVRGYFQRNEPLLWYVPWLENSFSNVRILCNGILRLEI